MGSVWVARGALSLLATTLGFAACGGGSSSSPPDASSGATSGQATGGAADVVVGRSDGGTGTFATAGGAAGVAGSAGDGGAGGQPPEPAFGGPPLGRACSSDADCEDLQCILSTDNWLTNRGAPPRGLCSKPCQLPNALEPDDECTAIAPDAICYAFEGQTGFCIEGCSLGPPKPGQAKCHNRPEFACMPALYNPTNSPCLDSVDCSKNEYCSAGVCVQVATGCLPTCRGDLDCEPGLHCDHSWPGGACVETAPTGKALGEACTVPGPDEPDEPDECTGYCSPDTRGASDGHCQSVCPYGQGCEWNAETQLFDGACMFISSINGASTTPGDFGFCNVTCNCSDECKVPGERCVQYGNLLSAKFKGPGVCLAPVRFDKFVEACAP